jgi:hypothetical protein
MPSVIARSGIPEVLVLRIVPSRRTASMREKSARLASRSSMIASQIHAHAPASAKCRSKVPTVISAAFAGSSNIGARPAAILASARSTTSAPVSSSTTRQPVSAHSAAMPLPIVPAPRTAALAIGRLMALSQLTDAGTIAIRPIPLNRMRSPRPAERRVTPRAGPLLPISQKA